MRFMLWLSAALLLTVSVASAQTMVTTPDLHKVRAGETERSVAENNGLTVAQLRQLNRNLLLRERHALKVGEELNVNPYTSEEFLGEYRWQFVGGDPAGFDLRPLYEAKKDSLFYATIHRRLHQQLGIFHLPEEVKEAFISQMEWQEPRVVNLYSSPESTLVLQGLIFGGYERTKLPNGKVNVSKLKYWDGNVACLWKDPRTHHRIRTQAAAVYDGVKYNGFGYRLIIFLGCQNGAFVKYELEPEPVELPSPPPIKVAAPCPPPETTVVYVPVPVPPVPMAVVPPLVTAPTVSPYYTDCVMWLTPEVFRIDPNGKRLHDRNGENIFAGHEHTYWNAHKNVGLRYRMSEARFNLWSSNARAGDYNAGLVGVPVATSHFRLDLEGGPWYSAAERVYYKFSEPTPGDWRWNPKKVTVDGYGLYARSQLLLPYQGYLDYKVRGVSKLLTENGGFITFRPGWLYLKAGANLQIRKEVTRHTHGNITFPRDTMTMRDARAGIVWSRWFMTYGSWNHWQYYSDRYYFTRFGPGGGFEWNFQGNSLWRLDGDVIRFRDFDDGIWMDNNVLTHHHSVNHEWRLKLGLVYSPATVLHVKHKK